MRPLLGVRRDRGQRYLFLTIVSFAVTVMVVRVYLDAAGYPKVGGGGLHVAHMLWGGLLLVVAVVVQQLFVGQRALMTSAIAAGVGVGLFIDEVGKFITESNDYFFAPAAPIIYGAILLLLLLWLVIRRDRAPTFPEATHGAIEAVRDLADGRLTRHDRDRAADRLRRAGASRGDGEVAPRLLALLLSADTEAHLTAPGWLARGGSRRLFRRLLPESLERLVIRVGLILSLLPALVGLIVAAAFIAGDLPSSIPIPRSGPIEFPQETIWIVALMVVWIVVGVANGLALVLSLTGHHRRGIAIAEYAVLAGLVAGGVLSTYVSQLGALVGVLLQLLLLLLIIDQRSRIRAREAGLPEAETRPDVTASA